MNTSPLLAVTGLPASQRLVRPEAPLFAPLWTAAVLLPLLLFAGTSRWSWRMVEAEAKGRLVHRVTLLREQALRTLETQEALLTAVQLRTAGMAWREIAGSTEVAAFLKALDDSTAVAGALGMVDPAGQLVQFSGLARPLPAADAADRDLVAVQPGSPRGVFVSQVYRGRIDGEEAFTISRPRIDADGVADGGALTVTFRVADFSAFHAVGAEQPGDTVMLLRRDGQLLARHPPLPVAGGQALAPGTTPMLAAAAADQGGTGIAQGPSPFDGEQRLFAARRLEGYPLDIVYGLHPEGPRNAWLRQVYPMAASASGGMLLLLGLTALAQRRTQRVAARERDALTEARQAAEGRAEAEQALRRGQRLAVLGQVVAGVAHDFRNVTQAVQSGARLMTRALDRGDLSRARSIARMISDAAGRGVDLVQRMLRTVGSHGRAPLAAAAIGELDVAAALAEAAGLLGRTIGPGHRIRLQAAPGLPTRIRGDRAELEAALLNLALNARDAMPKGGEIVLRAQSETVVAEAVAAEGSHPAGLAPGRYARIDVVDTGSGMDAETLAKIERPFFTTKPEGEGTGLGLATARAFVQGAGGGLGIASPGPGQGCTVTLWLPEAG